MQKLLWLFLLLPLLGTRLGQAQSRPNVVLILADDMGWGDMSSHKNPVIETPVLDRLASQGARFERFYVSPLCAPTRASLLTGRYHLRTGVASVTSGLETMRSSEVTLAEVFKTAGYATGAFGKWHNGAHYPENPQGQGFQEFLGFCGGHWTNYFSTTLQQNGHPVKTNGYITDVLTDAALGFIERNKTKPFLCYVPYNAPHSPYQVPDAYFNKYKAKGVADREAAVYGMVDNMDENIGRILQKLDELALSDNTIVIFLSDNGPNTVRYNGDMKGIKASVDEGGSRVPFFIRWPGKIRANTRIEPIAAHIDLLPTLVELAGIARPDTARLDGKSMVPLLNGKTASWPERTLFTHVLKTDSTYVINLYPGASRTTRYRFVRGKEADELYDMLADPGQKQNIVAQKPAVTAEFRKQYDAWFADVTQKGIHPEITQVGFAQSPVTELFAPDATKTGAVHYFARNGYVHDWFTGWQQPADGAIWTINVVEPGDYRVALTYNCSDGFTGQPIQVRIGAQTLEKPIANAFVGNLYPSPDRVTRIEAYEKDWATVPMGQVTLPKGQQKVQVRVNGKAPVPFELKSVLIEKLAR